MKEKPYLCQIPEYGISCVGCCMVDIYESREKLIQAVRENTTEYRALMKKNPTTEERGKFFNRESNIDRDSGLCSLLIFLDEADTRVGCAGHPHIHGVNYIAKFNLCNISYECPQTKKIASFPKSKRKLIAKKLYEEYKGDWIGLSIDMEKGRIKI